MKRNETEPSAIGNCDSLPAAKIPILGTTWIRAAGNSLVKIESPFLWLFTWKLLVVWSWGILFYAIYVSASVHPTLEEFENDQGFILKTHQMFSVHTTPEEFQNATVTGHFGFVFKENSVREITLLSWRHPFRKAPFSKCFLSKKKTKSRRFQIPPVWRAFSKSSIFVTD